MAEKMSCNVQPMQLLDLNSECLEAIFGYLKVEHLVNLVEAYHIDNNFTEKLFPNDLVKAKYIRLEESLNKGFCKITGGYCFVSSNPDELDDLKKLLQHFGHLLSRIWISYVAEYRRFDGDMEEYVSKYCNETLKEISITGVYTYTMHGISHSFSKVQKVTIENGSLNDNLSRFNIWFPSMQYLKLYNLKVDRPECIEQHFPFLEHLSIKNVAKNYDKIKLIKNSNLQITFKRNPQLKSLCLTHDSYNTDFTTLLSDLELEFGIKINHRFLNDMQQKLPRLTNLQLSVSDFYWQQHEMYHGSLNFCNLEYLKLTINHVGEEPYLLFSRDILVTAKYICYKDVPFDYDAVILWLQQNGNIKKLQLFALSVNTLVILNDDMITAMLKLSKLTELELCYSSCSDVLSQFQNILQLLWGHLELTKVIVHIQFLEARNETLLEQMKKNLLARKMPKTFKLNFSENIPFKYCMDSACVTIEKCLA